MIDTRFPPQPKKILQPLYPPSTAPPSNKQIEPLIANHYQTDHILLCSGASAALYLFLRWLRTQTDQQYIALPAFSCPDLCHAIIQSRFQPLFLDLTPQFLLSPSSIEFASSHSTAALIWPQLFEERPLPQKTIQLIHNKKLLLINDEAQVFPSKNPNQCRGAISLFSFGPSKRLAAAGGGGLCFHNEPIILKKEYLAHTMKRAHQTHLDRLLEKYPFIDYPLHVQPLSPYQEQVAVYHWNQINQLSRMTPLFSSNRYALAEKLAHQGIQSTWYYYPLNRLSFLKKYPSEPTPNSDRLAAEILIIRK